MLNIKELTTRIENIIAYSENLKVFRLRLPDGNGFSFVTGQFVMVSLSGNVDANGRKIAKAYSIASSPSQSNILELCIASYPAGALSPKLFQKGVGDEVIVTGPYGVFQLKTPVPSGTVFIAGGTGLSLS